MIGHRSRRTYRAPAGPGPTIPDPTVAWWKFHENDQASAIPDATGGGNLLTINNFNVANWELQNGRAAYHFNAQSGNYARSPSIAHNIGTGDFTYAMRGNPYDYSARTNHSIQSNGSFSPSLVGNRNGNVTAYWDAWLDSGIFAVPNLVNWFILRRSGTDLNCFHDGQKGATSTAAQNMANAVMSVCNNGSTSAAEMAVDEVRFYDVALTDQQCFDLMNQT